ncbi:hypothetical protein [Globicatella sp. PHS-GS-PNBC-21-1553]|uniref:hypothetical protein n=1 Tax=Globicatella sp. PHS-GS-PNBC-21-1553 TaxID=2885764 RepID=UPI00298F01E9|nr:hypothetical protein [Globicatella sp. PHS-GS-PNBC-21-1553]WPC08007.1 hypothetical protein LB888_08100 [Globicatella sp. PHS-GS-PNBC-21-1553]
MIISLEEAQAISLDIKEQDILALQQVIIDYTNNHFRTNIYEEIQQIDDGGLMIEHTNQFLADDIVEIEGTTFEDGVAIVREVSGTHLKIDLSGRGDFPIDINTKAKVYLIKFPLDVKLGAVDVLKNKIKAMNKTGIKSESIGRMSITYANVSEFQDSIYGIDAAYFSFLDPYRKFNWT